MKINNRVENTLFEKIEEYVIKNTSLTITDTYMDSITIFGKVGTLTNMDLTIEYVGDELYECDGTISYQGYDANPTDMIGIRKFVKSEKEVINLIDKSISVANKLINTVCQLEKEVND
jgi:hypothetical protein